MLTIIFTQKLFEQLNSVRLSFDSYRIVEGPGLERREK